MKTTHRSQLPLQLAVFAALFSLSHLAPAQTIWTGGNGVSATTNWSDNLNWSTGLAPADFDPVRFHNDGATGAAGEINNVVDAAFGGFIGSLQYANTNGTHTTFVLPGGTLNVGGNLTAGTEALTDISGMTNTITGAGGTVLVNNPGGNLIVRQWAATSSANRTTLDLSGLGTFNANVSRVLVGASVAGGGNRSSGRLLLARTNVITAASGTAPAIDIGESAGNNGNGSSVFLGQTNALFANTMTVGRYKERGTLLAFNSLFSDPSLLIRGADGFSRMITLAVADSGTGSATANTLATANLSLGTVDIQTETLQVARTTSHATAITPPQQIDGTFTFAAGVVDVNTLQLGLHTSAAGRNAVGVMNVNGSALLVVNNALELGRAVGGPGTETTRGVLNINGGTVRANQISANFGNLTNTIINTGGSLVISNLAGAGINGFLISDSKLTVPVATDAPSLIVTNLTMGATSNQFNITEIPVVAGYPAQFTIIQYSGLLAGTFNGVLGSLPASTPAYAGFISNHTANSSIDLVITSGPQPARALSWSGATDSNWDTTTPNWRLSAAPATYNHDDFVRFDDTATGTTTVNLTGTMLPSSVTVSNQAKTYGFTGSGLLSGSTGITKDGTGTLNIINSGGNDYTGGLNILAGTVRVGDGGFNGSLGAGNIANDGALIFNRADFVTVADTISGFGSVTKQGSGVLTLAGANSYDGVTTVQSGTLSTLNNSALGTTSGATTVSSGASLDVNARNLGAEPVFVSGTGDVGNGADGAIINSGAGQNNALRYVTLQGNTTFGGPFRWDIRGAPSTADPANAGLSTGGNPYKLTKVGFNQVSLVGVTVDPALGDVDVQQGIFALETVTTGLGNPAGNLTVAATATLQFFNLTNHLNKIIALTGDGFTASIINAAGANTIVGPITLVNDCVFTVNGTSLNVAGNLAGGVLTKQGSGQLILSGSATHGGTLASVGLLTLTGTHSGGVTNTSTFTAFAGTGTVSGVSDIAGYLLPGGTNAVGTLTLAELLLQGGAEVGFELTASTGIGGGANDLVVVNGNLTVNGNAIKINPVGLLQLGVPYRLFNYTGTLIENSPFFASSVGAYNFTVDTSTPGQVNVVASGGPPVWNGGSATGNNWSDPANWNGVSIVSGDTLYFAGGARLNNINDTLAETSYTDLVFSTGAGAFTLNGNPITLAGNIVNDSTNPQKINLGVNFNTARTFNGASGALIIGGGVTNTANLTSLTLAGSGTLTNLLASADPASLTNILSLRSNANWTLMDNASSAAVTVPWNFQLGAGTLNFGSGDSAPTLTSTTGRGAPGDNSIGMVGGAAATLNINSGVLTLTARLNTGTAGNATGIVNVVNGTFNVDDQVQGANGAATSASFINISGGTFNVGGTSPATATDPLYVASRGPGTLTISGSGALNCGILDVSRSINSGIPGIVDLDGGTLTCTRVGTATANAGAATTGSTATFNFNGGTLKARANSTTFFQGNAGTPTIPIAAFVKSGGAIFDTDGFNTTTLEPLQHDAALGETPDGGLTKNGAGTLTLSGASSYTGPTVVNAGTLLVNGSIGATAVSVESGGTLGGTGNIGNNVTVKSGGTITAGADGAVGNLTVAGNVTLQAGATALLELNQPAASSDQIRAIAATPTTITYAGTLALNNLAGTLVGGESFKLFSATNYSGAFSDITPATPGVGLAWDTSALSTSGTISVVTLAIPQITNFGVIGGNVVLSGTSGPAGGTYTVLTTTDLSLPIASWTQIATGNFDGSGNFSYTNGAPADPQRFYLLQVP